MENKRLPAMWKLFVAILAAGVAGGAIAPVVGVAAAGGRGHAPGAEYWAGSVAAGLVWAFVAYAYVKSMLRAFVRKLHTLERVVAGTEPPPLPGPLTANEIDEVEQSAARILAKLDGQRAEAGA